MEPISVDQMSNLQNNASKFEEAQKNKNRKNLNKSMN
jgi:hypothetical protein